MSGITCEHNMKERKEGLCSDCAKLKPYTVFKTCRDECFACNECGYFWGSGQEDQNKDRIGKPIPPRERVLEKKNEQEVVPSAPTFFGWMRIHESAS